MTRTQPPARYRLEWNDQSEDRLPLRKAIPVQAALALITWGGIGLVIWAIWEMFA